ncbi:DUF7344 domain-containing protein [Halorarius halobius]|uniref:DUF7344 domain-containing protein n=1 Tax=Halorarius halobius TaxID=2962671 RepID=UPI0020CDE803|nr:hypothetical protein [Halorarius halobius]
MSEVDAGFRALAHGRRRTVVRFVVDHRTVSLPDLAEHVAERELDADRTAVPDELVRDVYFSLYHTHVPVLEEVGLIDYSQQRDLVRAAGGATAVLRAVRDEVEELL